MLRNICILYCNDDKDLTNPSQKKKERKNMKQEASIWRAPFTAVRLHVFLVLVIQLNRSYKYNENIARTGISILNGHISKPAALRKFQAHMRPFSVIFWVLEVSHSVTFLPKYGPGNGKEWEKRKFSVITKMSM